MFESQMPPSHHLQTEASSADPPDEPRTEHLLAWARRGDSSAWQQLVLQFRPLVRRVASRYRLNERDIEDVDQTVWLRLIENLERIREPNGLPKWLVTTTSRESLRLARQGQRTLPVDALQKMAEQPSTDHADDPMITVLRRELSETVRRGLAELPEAQRELLNLLADERQPTYSEISKTLAMPIGSIGPTRARGLARLRESVALTRYLSLSQSEQCSPA